MNTNGPAGEDRVYYFLRSKEMVIKAPDVPDEAFTSWYYDDYGHVFDHSEMRGDTFIFQFASAYLSDITEITLQALYKPVVKKIEIIINEDVDNWAPSAEDHYVEKIDHVYFTVTNTYEIAQTVNSWNFFGLRWSPNPVRSPSEPYYAMYNYNTAYTATVQFLTGNERAHLTNVETNEEMDIDCEFLYADDLEVTINGRRATYDKEWDKAFVTFPVTGSNTTKLLNIIQPDNIEGLPYGTGEDEIRGMLPENASIAVANQSVSEAPITWNSLSYPEDADLGEMGPLVWTAHGTVELPEKVSNDNNLDLDVSMTIGVKGADFASAPVASLGSGEYLSSVDVVLSTATSGGEIHYTTDDNEATADSPVYDGEAIRITRDMAGDDGIFTIHAHTVKAGMRDSLEACYEYRFKDSLTVPKGNNLTYNAASQIGVYAGEYYTLEAEPGSGVTIDSEGNATATKAGEYTVKAVANDGFKWKIKKTVEKEIKEYVLDEDMNEQEVTRTVEVLEDDFTTDDQDITFTIGQANLTGAKVTVSKAIYTGKALKPAVKVALNGVVLPSTDYSVSYSNNKKVGKGIVTVTGRGNFQGKITGTTFKIVPAKATVKKLTAGKKKLTVTMSSKPSKKGGTYYQIQYRVKGSSKWKTVNKKKGNKVVIKKLKTGKKYQIRVRAYKTVSGKKYYGAWSKVKTSKKIK